jgi:hypothetical protein
VLCRYKLTLFKGVKDVWIHTLHTMAQLKSLASQHARRSDYARKAYAAGEGKGVVVRQKQLIIIIIIQSVGRGFVLLYRLC